MTSPIPISSIPVEQCPVCTRLFIQVTGHKYTDTIRTELFPGGPFEIEPARLLGFSTSCGCEVAAQDFYLLIEPNRPPRFMPQSTRDKLKEEREVSRPSIREILEDHGAEFQDDARFDAGIDRVRELVQERVSDQVNEILFNWERVHLQDGTSTYALGVRNGIHMVHSEIYQSGVWI